jgi:predicted RND superfamily exporter protein
MTAACFGIIMIAALVVHGRRKEYKFLPLPLIVLGLCTTVAWFRFSAL